MNNNNNNIFFNVKSNKNDNNKSKIFNIFNNKNIINNTKNDNLNNDNNNKNNFLCLNKIISVTVNIIFSYNNLNFTFIFNVHKKQNNSILINEILSQIHKKIPLFNFLISYYNETFENYILIGKFPLKNEHEILINNKKTFDNNIFLKIKLRQINFNENFNKNIINISEKEEDDDEEENEKAKIKRAKERKIGFIIKKVYLWRKMYCGFSDEKGNNTKLSLKEAAEKVGISKKSLDDYLIQLRIGKILGFNFYEHQNEKVGVLRNFVKKKRNLLNK
jgi:hypothetical protein